MSVYQAFANRYRSSILTGLLLFLVGLIGVSLTACDIVPAANDENDDNDSNGVVSDEAFSISVQGDEVEDRSIEGRSWFVSGTDPETGESAFIIYFTDADEVEQASTFGFVGRAGTRPAANETLDFLDLNPDEDDVTPDILEDQVVFFLIEHSAGEMNFYTSRDGTFSLSASESSRVAGNMDIAGYSMHMDFESHAEPEQSYVDVGIEFDAASGDFLSWENFQP